MEFHVGGRRRAEGLHSKIEHNLDRFLEGGETDLDDLSQMDENSLFIQTIQHNLFQLLREGVDPSKLIVVSVFASSKERERRNNTRGKEVHKDAFYRFGLSDRGGLKEEEDLKKALESAGTTVLEIDNNHCHERLFRRELIDLVEDEIMPRLEGGRRVVEGQGHGKEYEPRL